MKTMVQEEYKYLICGEQHVVVAVCVKKCFLITRAREYSFSFTSRYATGAHRGLILVQPLTFFSLSFPGGVAPLGTRELSPEGPPPLTVATLM